MATLTLDGNQMQEFELVERVRRWMRGALELSRAVEETLADLVAAYTPLLAPLIPATIGFENVKNGLGWENPQAFLYAVIVEFLGLATVTTALQFRAWNTQQNKKAPIWIAILMAGFYLVVTLLVNVLLDTGTDLQKWVKAAASTFSIIGAITMALRNEQAKRVAEAAAQAVKMENHQQAAQELARQDRLQAEERARVEQIAAETREYQRRVDEEERERKFQLKKLKLETQVSEKALQVSENEMKVSNFPETFGKWSRWPQVPNEQRRRIAGLTVEQLMEQFGIEERTAYNWLEYSRKELQA